MDQLLAILKDVRPDVDFSSPAKLMDDGILDSFDIVAIVGEISIQFDIQVPVEAITPDNFNSAADMMAMVGRLKAEG